MTIHIIIFFFAVAATWGCRPRAIDSSQKDTSILTTPSKDQMTSSICWAFAVTSFLEQRAIENSFTIKESTLSPSKHLLFSESFLALASNFEQLEKGEELTQSLRLSAGFALLTRWGAVPVYDDKGEYFDFKYDDKVFDSIDDQAQKYWANHQKPANSPIPTAEISGLFKQAYIESGLVDVAKAKSLSQKLERAFNETSSEITLQGKTWNQQKLVTDKLGVSTDLFSVLSIPSPGREAFTDQMSREYKQTIRWIKLALLSGFSVPISFNVLDGAEFREGRLGCLDENCSLASLSTPNQESRHANHAALLVDYRTEKSRFLPTKNIVQSLESDVLEWVIKNSWGFNRYTSTQLGLERRFVVPTYTRITSKYLETSHRLDPLRYEAIVPKEVLAETYKVKDQNALRFNPKDRIQYENGVKQNEKVIRLMPSAKSASHSLGFSDKFLTSGSLKLASPEANVRVCVSVQVGSETELAAVFLKPIGEIFNSDQRKYEFIALGKQNDWKYCEPVAGFRGELDVTIQALNKDFKPLAEVRSRIKVED